jgi:hypothetical protein
MLQSDGCLRTADRLARACVAFTSLHLPFNVWTFSCAVRQCRVALFEIKTVFRMLKV